MTCPDCGKSGTHTCSPQAPFAFIGKQPVFSAKQVSRAFEDGRRAMLDEVLKIAPDSVKVLIERLQEGK